MKKLAVFSLILVLLLSFAACRNNKTPEATTPPVTTAPTTEPAPTIIPTMPDVIEPNVPDENVDNDTLQDMIPDATDVTNNGSDANNGAMNSKR